MSLCSVKEDTTVFHQGNPGQYFYHLKKGQADLYIDNNFIKTFKEGESFGELALIHGAPRSGTVVATTDCLMWCLERKAFRNVVDTISQLNLQENRKFLDSVAILAELEEEQKNSLARGLMKEFYSKGRHVIKQGDLASCFYMVKKGIVGIYSNGQKVRILERGEIFGDRFLFTNSNRTMSCVAESDLVLYSLSKESLKNMIGVNFKENILVNFIKVSLRSSFVFGDLDSNMFNSIFELAQIVEYSREETVVDTDHITSSELIIIIEGSVIDPIQSNEIATKGEILFEHEVFNSLKTTSPLKMVAYPDCLCVRIKTKALFSQLKMSFPELKTRSLIVYTFKQVPLFSSLSESKLKKLLKETQVRSFSTNHKLLEEGKSKNVFFLVKKGNIVVTKNNKFVGTLGQNGFYGENALLKEELSQVTVIADGKAECFVVEKEGFDKVVEGNTAKYLENKLYLSDSSVELKDLELVDELGIGRYGKVVLVKNLKTNFKYAIKSISKKEIEKSNLREALETEKELLLSIDHPFLVKLVKILKDSRFIYFLKEFVEGEQLSNVMQSIGLFSKEQTQFYGASILETLQYLHSLSIIYRDVKPENIIVTESGFIKIIDFGTAKTVKERTSTVVGTPHYMAPEVIMGEGYSFSVDSWSTAICMFEFYCGEVPFGEYAQDPMEVYLAIIDGCFLNQ